MRPALGRSIPPIERTSEVLPAPFEPTIAKRLSLSTSNESTIHARALQWLTSRFSTCTSALMRGSPSCRGRFRSRRGRCRLQRACLHAKAPVAQLDRALPSEEGGDELVIGEKASAESPCGRNLNAVSVRGTQGHQDPGQPRLQDWHWRAFRNLSMVGTTQSPKIALATLFVTPGGLQSRMVALPALTFAREGTSRPRRGDGLGSVAWSPNPSP